MAFPTCDFALLKHAACFFSFGIAFVLHGCGVLDGTPASTGIVTNTSAPMVTNTSAPTPQPTYTSAPTPQPTSGLPNQDSFEGASYRTDQLDHDIASLMDVTNEHGEISAPTCWEGEVYHLSRIGPISTGDHVGLFSCDAGCGHCANSCVLSWEGTKTVGDWIHDIEIVTSDWCGMQKLHAGFVHELKERMSTSGWNQIKAALLQLQSSNKCSIVYSVGHSLGAAVAEIFAHCAKRNEDALVTGSILPSTIVKIYAFAPPAVQGNGAQEDAWLSGISGKRFHSIGEGKIDPVPAITQTVNFHHPSDIVVVELDLDDPLQSKESSDAYYQANAPNNCCPKGWGKFDLLCNPLSCLSMRSDISLHYMKENYLGVMDALL